MRIELRAEIDEHEYTVTLEMDRSVSVSGAVSAARNALIYLVAVPPDENEEK